jgi:hypothetical protein
MVAVALMIYILVVQEEPRLELTAKESFGRFPHHIEGPWLTNGLALK